jgi:hypothetical protein
MITKYLLPIVAVISMALGSAGTVFLTKAVRPRVEVSCPPAPDCNCPEQKPCNGIDFDKIKSRAITIQNTQYLTVNGDTVLVQVYIKALQAELAKLRLARCR